MISYSKQPGLYVTATPIGNIGDMTPRASWVLQTAERIACEDKRVTGKLMDHLAIKRQGELVTYNDHSDYQTRDQLVKAVEQGAMVALVSDAGMPLISDPGYKLVKACKDKGLPVYSVPGASSVSAALSVSGLPSDHYHFYGFLPTKSGPKSELINRAIAVGGTAIVFESAQRILNTVKMMADIEPSMSIAVAREVTKKFEEVIAGTAVDVSKKLQAHESLKGEIVLLFHSTSSKGGEAISDHQIKKALKEAQDLGVSSKDVAKILSALLDHSKNEIYAMTLD